VTYHDLESGEIMGKVSIKGVLIGGIVDVGSSMILGIPFAIYAISRIDLASIPKDHVESAVNAAMLGNLPLYLTQELVGLTCSIFGGYIAARIAKHHELLNGGLASYLCLAIGVYAMTHGKDSHPLYVQVLMLIASPALGILGGYLRLRQKPVVAISA
jgi:hypothetical protein